MKKKIFIVLVVLSLFLLSACGTIRNSNDPPNPETQLNNKDKNLPNTGNKEVNVENDGGTQDRNGLNDHLLE